MASRPHLPELDVEAMTAEEILALVPRRSSRAASRSPAPSRRRSRCCSTCCFALEPKARVFALDTHVLFPETYEVWREVEQRYGTKVEVYEGPSLGAAGRGARRRALGAQARPLLRDPQGRAARPRARATSTRGSPACAATSRRRARTRRSSAGTRRTSSGRRTRSPTGTTSAAGTYIRERDLPVQPAARRAATRRSAARTARCPAPGARAAGRGSTRPSAACMSPRSRGVDRQRRNSRRSDASCSGRGSSLWFTGPLGRRQVDDRRASSRAELEAARPARRPARRRRRARRTCRRASASRRRTATRTSRASAGSPRGSRAPAPRSIVSAISPYEETRRNARGAGRAARAVRRGATSRRRSRSARAATRRASTRRRSPARSTSSPASPSRTRRRPIPSCGSTPRAGRRASPPRSCSRGSSELGLVDAEVRPMSTTAGIAHAPRRARGRGDPHHARGRRGA